MKILIHFYFYNRKKVTVLIQQKVWKRLQMDTVDLALSREPGYSEDKAEKADVFDSFISLVSILTYIADISTDIFLAYQYYKAQQWNWFIPTVVFIVVPSMALQLFSSKWYHDDSGKQPTISKLMHLFQLGTIER